MPEKEEQYRQALAWILAEKGRTAGMAIKLTNAGSIQWPGVNRCTLISRLAKCKATKNRKSFALGAGHRGGCVQQRPRALSPRADLRPLLLNSYELYALTNWSAVPNGDWNA